MSIGTLGTGSEIAPPTPGFRRAEGVPQPARAPAQPEELRAAVRENVGLFGRGHVDVQVVERCHLLTIALSKQMGSNKSHFLVIVIGSEKPFI